MSEEYEMIITIKQEPEPDPLDTNLDEKCVKTEVEIETKNSYETNLDEKCVKTEVEIETKNSYETHKIKSEMPPESQNRNAANDTNIQRSGINMLDLEKNTMRQTFTVRDCITEALYLCEFCQEYFTAYNLQEHIAFVHDKERLLSCIVCMKDFLPSNGTKTIKCDDCTAKSNKVTSKSNLRYKCETCGKGFLHRCYLKRHMYKHEGIKPYSCERCNRKFSERGNLRQHMVIHTDRRPHACSYCNKTFPRVSLLKRHIFHHTGELSSEISTFTCKICTRVFPFRHCLTRHMRIHTGQRPFQCSLCEMSFTDSGNLKRHISSHTGGDFECDVCGKKYVQKSNLQFHILHHHMGPIKKKVRKKK